MTTLRADAHPPGWKQTTLGKLGNHWNGRGFKKSEWRESGRPIIRIQNLTRNGVDFNYFQGAVDEKNVVRRGDLLMSWAATLGVYEWDGPEAVLNQHIFKIESFIEKRFHRYLLESVLADLRRQAHGSGMVHITRGSFEGTEVWIPDGAEQRRIVAVIEEDFSRIDVGLEALRRAYHKLKVMRTSAVETELKRIGGLATPLIALLRVPLGNGRSVPDAKSGGPSFPVLRLTALRNGRVIVSEAKRGDWDRTKAAPYLVRRGDFLVARGNGSLDLVGRGGLSTEDAEVAFPDTMIRVRIDESRVLPAYLAIVWDSARIRQYLRASARTTAGIYKINQTHLEKLEVPVPPLPDQAMVIDRVTTFIERTNRLGASVSLAIKRVESLRSALLVAAFTGRLPTGTGLGQAGFVTQPHLPVAVPQ